MVRQSIGPRKSDPGRQGVEQAVLALGEAEKRLKRESTALKQLNRNNLNEPWTVSTTVTRFQSAEQAVIVARRNLDRAWAFYERTERIGVPALLEYRTG